MRSYTFSFFPEHFPTFYGPQFHSSFYARRRALSCSKVSWRYLSSKHNLDVPRKVQSQLGYWQPPLLREGQFRHYRRRVSYRFSSYQKLHDKIKHKTSEKICEGDRRRHVPAMDLPVALRYARIRCGMIWCVRTTAVMVLYCAQCPTFLRRREHNLRT